MRILCIEVSFGYANGNRKVIKQDTQQAHLAHQCFDGSLDNWEDIVKTTKSPKDWAGVQDIRVALSFPTGKLVKLTFLHLDPTTGAFKERIVHQV